MTSATKHTLAAAVASLLAMTTLLAPPAHAAVPSVLSGSAVASPGVPGGKVRSALSAPAVAPAAGTRAGGPRTLMIAGLLKGDHVPMRSEYWRTDPRATGPKLLVVESSNGRIVSTQPPLTTVRTDYVATSDGESLYVYIDGNDPNYAWTVTFYRPFSFDGDHPVAASDVQDTGSPAQAMLCATAANQDHLAKVFLKALGAYGMLATVSRNGAPLFSHYLSNKTGTARSLNNTSVPDEVTESEVFQKYDRTVVQPSAAWQWTGGQQVALPQADVRPVNFPYSASGGDADLYWTFAGTQGMKIHGHVSVDGTRLKGKVTYLIKDSYGFGNNDKFFWQSKEFYFLQTVCGAPHYPAGAHWFPSSVEVTVPYDQPGPPPL